MTTFTPRCHEQSVLAVLKDVDSVVQRGSPDVGDRGVVGTDPQALRRGGLAPTATLLSSVVGNRGGRLARGHRSGSLSGDEGYIEQDYGGLGLLLGSSMKRRVCKIVCTGIYWCCQIFGCGTLYQHDDFEEICKRTICSAGNEEPKFTEI